MKQILLMKNHKNKQIIKKIIKEISKELRRIKNLMMKMKIASNHKMTPFHTKKIFD